MVLSNELTKLKQTMKAQEGNSPSDPSPVQSAKPVPQPILPKTLEEEDDLFLSAMGKPAGNVSKKDGVPQGSDAFTEAMSQLKGIKPKEPEIPISALTAKDPIQIETVAQQKGTKEENMEEVSISATLSDAAVKELPEHTKCAGSIESPKKVPEKIQLAAGMVIEVDGVLDIRNHNAQDARERLKERVLDGVFLGWRSLHVILGNSDPLQQVLFDYINSPQSCPLAKYAQAPVPMGGATAWVLYYGAKPVETEVL